MKAPARRADFNKAAYHGLLIVAALIEYRCCRSKFRKQLCGAWAGFHAVSVLLDLAGPIDDKASEQESE